jgi:hypothetical protein
MYSLLYLQGVCGQMPSMFVKNCPVVKFPGGEISGGQYGSTFKIKLVIIFLLMPMWELDLTTQTQMLKINNKNKHTPSKNCYL